MKCGCEGKESYDCGRSADEHEIESLRAANADLRARLNASVTTTQCACDQRDEALTKLAQSEAARKEAEKQARIHEVGSIRNAGRADAAESALAEAREAHNQQYRQTCQFAKERDEARARLARMEKVLGDLLPRFNMKPKDNPAGVIAAMACEEEIEGYRKLLSDSSWLARHDDEVRAGGWMEASEIAAEHATIEGYSPGLVVKFEDRADALRAGRKP